MSYYLRRRIQPFGLVKNRCLCGMNFKNGICVHCDSQCRDMVTSSKGCRRCSRVMRLMNAKDFIETHFYAAFDPEVFNLTEQIYKENERARRYEDE